MDASRAARHQATAAEPGNLNTWISALDLAVAHPASIKLSPVVAHLRALDPVDARGFRR